MASPYTAGALEARDIAEGTDVTLANVEEAVAIAASAGVNAIDVNTAATAFGIIADDTGELMVGSIALTTTSKVLASTLVAAPDFLMAWYNTTTANAIFSTTATSTTITFTVKTAGTGTVYYILGYTA